MRPNTPVPIRMQPFTWDDRDNPNFGDPIPEGVVIPSPSNYKYPEN